MVRCVKVLCGLRESGNFVVAKKNWSLSGKVGLGGREGKYCRGSFGVEKGGSRGKDWKARGQLLRKEGERIGERKDRERERIAEGKE